MHKGMLLFLSLAALLTTLTGCNMVEEIPGVRVSTVTLPVLVTRQPATAAPRSASQSGETAIPTQEVENTSSAISIPTTTPYPQVNWLLSSCDRINVLEDVTIPDGTALNPGEIFVKSWRLENAGQCDWNDNYRMVFYEGKPFDAPSSMTPFFLKEEDQIDINVGSWGVRTHKVEPGGKVDLAMAFRAPLEPGSYSGYWALSNEKQERVDPLFWVMIQVKEGESGPEKTWSGEWIIQDPYKNEPSLQRAVFYQVGRAINGFFFNYRGNLVLINAWAEEGSKSVKGEYGEPWQDYSTPFEWKLTDDMQHFQSLNRKGSTKANAWCGFRQGLAQPEPCELIIN